VLSLFLAWQVAAAEQPGKDNDRVLAKVTFIHFRKGHAKPSGGPGGGKKQPQGYYSYIAQGAKWRSAEPFLVNPACNDAIPSALVMNAVAAGMNEWETPGSATFDIFGETLVNESATYSDGAFRGFNTISFGSYGDPDVIGITTVWGYFGGRPSQREIIEAHILLNDAFMWGDASDISSLMDVQNILTHELGHCAGMGDVYEPAAGEETMYGYSAEGEVKKRDLYKGDTTGVTSLYK
jgi:hypothetical protein